MSSGGVGRDRLLEPQRVPRRDAAGEADRAGRGELAVGPEQEVGAVAHRRADRAAEGLGAVEVRQRRLVAAEDRVGPGGVELDRGEAGGDEAGRRGRRGFGVVVEGRRILSRARVEVGVGAQPVAGATAPERVDRAAARLAEDVPAGDLEPGEGAHHGRVRTLAEAGRIGPAKHQLDRLRALAGHVALEDVGDHRAHRRRPDRRGIDLAPAGDAVVGRHLDENEVASAEGRRRVADDQHLEVAELHRGAPKTTVRRALPERVASRASLIASSGSAPRPVRRASAARPASGRSARDVAGQHRLAHPRAEDALVHRRERRRVEADDCAARAASRRRRPRPPPPAPRPRPDRRRRADGDEDRVDPRPSMISRIRRHRLRPGEDAVRRPEGAGVVELPRSHIDGDDPRPPARTAPWTR